MLSLAIKGPILGWLIANLASGSPEYSDNYSSSKADVCSAQPTKTVFVTLTSSVKQSTVSIPSGASVETTTIIVSPVQSHAKTDATADAVSSELTAARSTTASSASSGASHPTADILSEEYSTVSRTILSTRTVTLTVAPSGKSGVATEVKGTSTGSAVNEQPSDATTCITHTVLGPDGRPTVVESTIVSNQAATTDSVILGTLLPTNSASATAPGVPVPSYGGTITSGLPIHTSFTAIGPDGSSTIVDTTWIIPIPPTSVISGLNPLPSGIISSGRVVSGLPSNTVSAATAESPVTSIIGTPTCTTVTVVGPDMRPTVTELTIIAPTGAATVTSSNLAPPSFVAPASMTNLASQPPITSNSVVTTITWKVIGADGTVSPIIQTITAPSGSIVNGIPTSLPAAVTAQLPKPAATISSELVPLLTPYGSSTAAEPTPSRVISLVSGLGSITTFVSAPPPIGNAPIITDEPPAYSLDTALPLSSYETPIGLPTLGGSPIPYGTKSPDDGWISSILYGSLPTPTPPPNTPAPAPPVPETPEPTPEPLPTSATPVVPETLTTLITSTWTNVIPEQTTTRVIKFPLTTMATITIPHGPALRKRLLRRQSSLETLFPFSNSSTSPAPFTENTSLISSLSSLLLTPVTTPTPQTSTIPTSTIPITSANTTTIVPGESYPTICTTGGDKVGNLTVNFDNLLPGPLLNPAGDLWFSEGFLVAPPSSPPTDAYIPSSGSQLVEFLPPALVPDVPFEGSGDTAEISVGPNEISPCFRFNFYGASLGCAAEGVEQWCEFEFSAYTYNEALGSEASLSWSETKRVPACPNFPHGPCPLTPVQLDGYNNVASILVTVRVGLELRAWWGDDFQIGWTDNTCEATTCRDNAVSRRAKREVFSRASRRGVWQWTPNGPRKLDDDYVWSSFE
ncbi:hypothetical protein NLG97_g5269 [Lecanicillium saksenae]|uniref:Uncharacterized protein n=1 Tax=Lecanicillium saksenae TaxID=468837 RepID=A0ACC1QVC6_9HYPO|nr:hypothetical protein NLG97_g5269 [Lecanicillium saksenae]